MMTSSLLKAMKIPETGISSRLSAPPLFSASDNASYSVMLIAAAPGMA